jgi:hypothetical protein
MLDSMYVECVKRRQRSALSLGPSIKYWPDGTETAVTGPPTYEAWFEEGWKVTLELGQHDGRLVVTRLTVSPENPTTPPLGGVTTTFLRTVKVAELVEDARSRASRFGGEPFEGDESSTAFGQVWNQTLDAAAGLAAAMAKPGRRRGDLIPYLDVAVEYARLLEAGSLAPAREMAERRQVPRTTVRTQLKVARDKGLLTRPSPGERIGGQLTDKARAMLADLEEE